MTKTFKDLIVWQKARDLAVEVYAVTANFPVEERYGMTSQMRRAVISISSNIAESYHRYNAREKDQFLKIAFGSGAELESQIAVSQLLFPANDYSKCESLLDETLKILNTMINRDS